jgi:glutaredoxin
MSTAAHEPAPPAASATPAVTIYGAAWCEDTRRTRRLLRRLGVAHRYRDVDLDLEAMEQATTLNHGVRRTPVVTLAGQVLVEPTNETLARTVVREGLLTREEAVSRLYVQNVGDMERLMRVSAGLLLIALERRAPRGTRGLTFLTGVSLLLTGVAGWCPVFSANGVSSLNGPADRPDEAERRAWLTRREPAIAD